MHLSSFLYAFLYISLLIIKLTSAKDDSKNFEFGWEAAVLIKMSKRKLNKVRQCKIYCSKEKSGVIRLRGMRKCLNGYGSTNRFSNQSVLGLNVSSSKWYMTFSSVPFSNSSF